MKNARSFVIVCVCKFFFKFPSCLFVLKSSPLLMVKADIGFLGEFQVEEENENHQAGCFLLCRAVGQLGALGMTPSALPVS